MYGVERDSETITVFNGYLDLVSFKETVSWVLRDMNF